MVDVDPKIWDNPTLGEATNNLFLDEVEAQAKEDRAARREGRTPETIQREVRYPTMPPSGSVPSSVSDKLVVISKGEEESPVEKTETEAKTEEPKAKTTSSKTASK